MKLVGKRNQGRGYLRGSEDKPAPRKIHLVEFGGRGGVFQHTLALGQRLARTGADVTLHTANDPETLSQEIANCRCFDWQRQRLLQRNFSIVSHFIFKTLPHLWSLNRNEIILVQGIFKTPLTFILIFCLRASRHTVAFSPHALEARGRGALGNLFLGLTIRLSNLVIVYNSKDKTSLDLRRVKNLRIQLYQYVPNNYAQSTSEWKNLLDRDKIKIGCIGQLREDKDYKLVVEVADYLSAQAVIVGEDLGAASTIAHLLKSAQGSHLFREEYLSIESLVGLLSSLDVVMLPYTFASQSGIAEISNSLGIPVVSQDQGALAEQSSRALAAGATTREWAQAVLDSINSPIGPHTEVPLDELIQWLGAQP